MGFYDAEKIGLTVGTIFLIPASVSDIRQRSVSRRLLIAGAAAAVSAAAFSVITGNRDAENVLLSLFPGALLLLSSRLTEGKVGIGDGCSLLVYGTAAGAGGALLTSAAGLFLTALTGLVLMAVKKAEKDTRIHKAVLFKNGEGRSERKVKGSGQLGISGDCESENMRC